MSESPKTWSLSWLNARERVEYDLACPPTLDDLFELGLHALRRERWGDAVAILSFVLHHRIHAPHEEHGSRYHYEREKRAEQYGKAHGAWIAALTVLRTMEVKKERNAEIAERRKRKKADRAFARSLGLTPSKR